jgi:hypothetical protein
MATDQFVLGLDRAASRRAGQIARLAPLARELAGAGLPLTVADVREEAVKRGILTGAERGRELSYLGAVMKAAGLRPLGTWRRSHVEKAHGNLNQEWGL